MKYHDLCLSLQEEKNGLHAKQSKLRQFIESPAFLDLSEMEQKALRLQAKAMADYYGILNQRLFFYETGSWPFSKLQ